MKYNIVRNTVSYCAKYTEPISYCKEKFIYSTTTTTFRSTQPCIPPGSINRVPASAGVKAGK